MCAYLPSTEAERGKMLEALGLKRPEDLYGVIPESLRYPEMDVPEAQSEWEVSRYFEGLAKKNHVYGTVLRGAGAYKHYIPAVVSRLTTNEKLLTSYTPYQAEISQGVLQSIFEWQTEICRLTGMDVANASVYDGATAAAEGVGMCVDRKRRRVLLSKGLHPMTRETIETYFHHTDVELEFVELRDGVTDAEDFASKLSPEIAGVVLQQPNFLGQLEDVESLAQKAHEAGAAVVLSVNPISQAVLKTAAEYGADIAVGDGQPLGLPLSLGGPYVGFMATKHERMRAMPGRIVGQTKDKQGRRAFVLTLQAREQHIRREKATSNICTNQAFCALTATTYLAALGKEGLPELAWQCYDKAHYLAEQLSSVPGLKLAFKGPFFHEFVTLCDKPAQHYLDALAKEDILGGLPLRASEEGQSSCLARFAKETFGDKEALLWCVTEAVSREELDRAVARLREV